MDIEKIVKYMALIIGCCIILYVFRTALISVAELEQERVFGIFCEKLAEGTLTCPLN